LRQIGFLTQLKRNNSVQWKGSFMAISTTIKSIQDIMRKDVGIDGDPEMHKISIHLLFYQRPPGTKDIPQK